MACHLFGTKAEQAIIRANADLFIIVNWALRDKLQTISLNKSPFDNVVCKMLAILFWPQCIKRSAIIGLCPLN